MSEIRVDNITDEAGTGKPGFPNGIGANAVDLNDYEEGTFTVDNAGDSSGVIGENNAKYIRIGNLVYIRAAFKVTTDFSSEGFMALPFQASYNTDVSSFTGLFTMVVNPTGGNTFAYVTEDNGSIDAASLQSRDLDYNTVPLIEGRYRISFWYFTDVV